MMRYFKLIAMAALILLANIPNIAHASDTPKSNIIGTLDSEISKKSKTWQDLAIDPNSKNYTYWKNCKTLNATQCYTYQLSHRKVSGRVAKILRVFDQACKDNGGQTTSGEDPSYDKIDKFFYANHKVVNRRAIPVISNQFFCAFDNTPALSIYIDSEQALRRADGNLLSKEAFYEKARIYIYISNLAKIQLPIKKIDETRKQETVVSKACMGAPLKIGDRSLFGLVVDIRKPLIQIQRETKLEWMRIEDVSRDIRECMK